MSRPVVLCYHARCPDGLACRYLMRLHFGERIIHEIPFTYSSKAVDAYHEEHPDYLYVCCDMFWVKAKYLVLIDHHYTSFKYFDPERAKTITGISNLVYKEETPDRLIYIDLGSCAATNILKVYDIDANKDYIALVDKLDRWEYSVQIAKISMGTITEKIKLSMTNPEFQELQQNNPEPFETIFQDLVQQSVVRKKEIAGHNYRYIMLPQTTNFQLANRFIMHKPFDFVIWYRRADNIYFISFRSTGRVNVAEVAEVYGGGGHYMASGCIMKKEVFLEFFDSLSQP